MRHVLAFIAVLFSAAASPASGELRLVMLEQDGCAYCARWNREIAPIYPKTPEGKAAPLERADIRGPYPDGLSFKPSPVFTPTFILVADGRETGRIEGYAGDDFFWGLLGRLLEQSGQYQMETGE
ncbi:hypothetical protein DEA8626_00064 [Defluviimonas aquaemixtae]|uniref:Regulatory protein SoxS n=1 Tax=Albidovulum aquaemixtae TaxID=1542388 RepID=A0A2R8B1P0_9RHOB|nr:hypothetical protein [Defluviimonas aquaemixtae]SPH16554.1 hypothetical protein DEA8626_00064 [Defluviimonas aquaemixtae]